VFVLDTDTASNFLAADRNYQPLRARVLAQPAGSVYLSVITLEEMLRGQLAEINRARTEKDPLRLVRRYTQFQRLYQDLHLFPLLPYDEAADRLYQALEPKLRNAHKQDARISAIAAARDYTVITRNLQHYEKIGLAKADDWTQG
jgi:tRNA(fMet)-specific endonuclease VapC